MLQKEELKKIKKNFSERLKNLMTENNLNNSILARKTGIDRNIIPKYLNKNNTNISFKNLVTLANYFDVSVSYLIGETEIRKADEVALGKEFNINDESIENLRKIKEINEKYNNKYSSLINRIITNPALYKILIKQTDIMLDETKQNNLPQEIVTKNPFSLDLEYDDYAEILVCQKFLELFNLYINQQHGILFTPESELKKQIKNLRKELKHKENRLKEMQKK